jgi:hypothetical protein
MNSRQFALNVGALLLYIIASIVTAVIAQRITTNWLPIAIVSWAVNAVAVFATYAKMRPACYVMAAFLAYQSAELMIHLSSSIRAVQGRETHNAVLLAAALGVALGFCIARGSARSVSIPLTDAQPHPQ